MAYKRYFKINGKTYGPYYYESYRDSNGKVKKKYVKLDEVEGGDSSGKKSFGVLKFSLFVFLLFGFFVAGVFFLGGFDEFTGRVVEGEDLVGSEEEGLVDSLDLVDGGDGNESEEQELVGSEELVVGSEDVGQGEEDLVTDYTNYTDSDNVTLENESGEQGLVESLELVEISEEDGLVSSGELVASSEEEGDLVESLELVVDSDGNETEEQEIVESLELVQYKAVVGRPVKWIARVNVSVSNFSLEIPGDASNISVLTGEEVDVALDDVVEFENLVSDADREDLVDGGITGNVVVDLDSSEGIVSRFWNWIISFSISGEVVKEDVIKKNGKIREEKGKTVVELDDFFAEEKLAVEYYTPAPYVVEGEDFGKKFVTVVGSEEVHYEEILAFSEIDEEVFGDGVFVYRTTGGIRERVSSSSYDLDFDGRFDYVEWVVARLSNQTYEIVGADNESLEIWDSFEEGSALVNETVDFFANYSNNSVQIGSAVCNISFDDGVFEMVEGVGVYNYSRNFSSVGEKSWNVSCFAENFSLLNVSDSVLVEEVNFSLSECGEIDSVGVYTLTNNVSGNGTCFDIISDDVVLDCNGYSINYSDIDSGYGVNVSGVLNFTLRDCFVYQTNDHNNYSYGVYFDDVNYSLVENSEIRTTAFDSASCFYNKGVYLFGSYYNNLTGNYIETNGVYGDVVFVEEGEGNLIFNNTLNQVGGNGQSSKGVRVKNSDNISILNNSITTISWSSEGINLESSSYGVVLYNDIDVGSSVGLDFVSSAQYSYHDHVIENNTVEGERILYYFDETDLVVEDEENVGQLLIAFSDSAIVRNLTMDVEGIYLFYSEDSLIEDCNISTKATQRSAIRLYGSNYSNITNNYLSATTWTSILSLTYSDWVTVYDNLFYSDGNNIRGVGLSVSDNGIYYNNNYTFTHSTETYGVYFLGGNNNNTFRDSYFDVAVDSVYFRGSNYDNYLVNISGLNKSGFYFYPTANNGEVYVSYWLDVNVSDSSGEVEGASVEVFDKDDTLVSSGVSDSLGIYRSSLVEFFVNETGSYYEYNNYTVNVSKVGYLTNSSGVNVSDNVWLDVLLGDSSAPLIWFVDPTLEDLNYTLNDFVYVNVSSNESNEYSAWLDWNGSLVGYWSFDSCNATGCFDNSSWGNFGEFENGLGLGNLTSGKRGEGLEFDGEGGYVSFDKVDFPNREFSLSFWMRSEGNYDGGNSNTSANLISSSGYDNGWRITHSDITDSTGKLKMIKGGNETTRCILISDSALELDAWYHVVGIWNSTDLLIYINGEFNGLLDCDEPYLDSVASESRIGSEWYGVGAFNGTLDEVMVLNRVLSEEEINASFDAGSYRLERNFTDLDDGNYSFVAYAVDEFGNRNSTEERSVEVGGGGVFKSTWNTSAVSNGSSNSTSLSLPLESSGSYDFVVYWGDGESSVVTSYDDLDRNHTYDSEGVYEVWIDGEVEGWRFNNGGDKLKILDVLQWGDLRLGDNGAYFFGCSNLDVSAMDVLNTSGMTDMSSAFMNCSSLGDVDFSEWDVSGVDDARYMFYNAYNFSSNLNFWNTSSVTDMRWMFYNAYSFTSDLSAWDVSKVVDTSYMFSNAYSFTSDLSAWDVSNVAQIKYMFSHAYNFTSDLSGWNVSKISDMTSLFSRAYNFNSNLSSWNTSKVTNMNYMFNYAHSFTSDLSDWDVSNVLYMEYMFTQAHNFNSNLSNWNTSSLRYTTSMFNNATNFNSDLDSWDVSHVSSMNAMFKLATSFDQDLNSWNVSNVSSMLWMFDGATNFNGNISLWDVSKVTSMYRMFIYTDNFNQDIGGWNVSNVVDMGRMFQYSHDFNQDISSWDTSKVVYMGHMFTSATSFNQDLGSWNVSSVDLFDNMLDNTNLSVENYDSLLIGWEALDLNDSMTFGASGLEYCFGEGARAVIISEDNWTFVGDSKNCDIEVNDFNESYTSGGSVALGEDVTVNASFFDNDLVDSVWVVVWKGAVGGSLVVGSWLMDLIGDFWTVTFGTNSSFNLGVNNYTVYANDSFGNEINYSGSFEVVSSCGVLSEANSVYVLGNDVVSGGTCFTVAAENVTLDCNGYTINYSVSGGANEVGVYSYKNYTKVRNCNVLDGNLSAAESVNVGRHGILFGGASHGEISGNNVSVYGNVSSAIYLSNSHNNNLTSNVGISDSFFAIRLLNSLNNSLTSNVGVSDSSYAISLHSSSYNNLTLNNGTSNSSKGILVEFNSNGNLLTSNVGFSNLNHGISIAASSSDNVLINNTAISETFRSFFVGDSDYNLIVGLNSSAVDKTYDAVYFYNSTMNNLTDCVYLDGLNDVRSDSDDLREQVNYITNCTYDADLISAGHNTSLVRQWWVEVAVNDSLGYLEGASVEIFDKDENLVESFESGVGSSRVALSEYVLNQDGYNYSVAHMINISKVGYVSNSSEVNLTALGDGNLTDRNFYLEVLLLYDTPNITGVIDVNESGDVDGSVYAGDNVTINVSLESNAGIENVWVVIWGSVVGGSVFAIWDLVWDSINDIWSVTFGTNSSFGFGEVNYTVYANNSLGDEVNESGSFEVLPNGEYCDFSEDYSLTGDLDCEDLVVESGVTLDTDGYTLNVSGDAFVNGTLDCSDGGEQYFWNLSLFENGSYIATPERTWILNNFWIVNNSVSHFYHDNGEVYFAGNSTVYAGKAWYNYFWNVTVPEGVTVEMTGYSTRIDFLGTFNLSGSLYASGYARIILSASTSELVLGDHANFTNTVGVYAELNNLNSEVNIPEINSSRMLYSFAIDYGANNTSINMTGNVYVWDFLKIGSIDTAQDVYRSIKTNGYNLTVLGDVEIGDSIHNESQVLDASGGGVVEVYGDFVLDVGGVYEATPGETRIGGDLNWTLGNFYHNDGLVNLTGSGIVAHDGSWPQHFKSLAMAASGETTTLGYGQIWIYGDLVLGNGTVTDGDSNYDIVYAGGAGYDYTDAGATFDFAEFYYRGQGDFGVLSRDYSGVDLLGIYPSHELTYYLEGDINCSKLYVRGNFNGTTRMNNNGYDVNCSSLQLGNDNKLGERGELNLSGGEVSFGSVEIYNGTYDGGDAYSLLGNVSIGSEAGVFNLEAGAVLNFTGTGGFGESNGSFYAIGNSTDFVLVTGVAGWDFEQDMDTYANYTTFEFFDSLRRDIENQRAVDAQYSVFRNSTSNAPVYLDTRPLNFDNSIIYTQSGNYYIHFDVDDLAYMEVVNFSIVGPGSTFTSGNERWEFINSSFDEVGLGTDEEASVVSKNHNGVLGDYYIWPGNGSFAKSDIVNDFGSGDSVWILKDYQNDTVRFRVDEDMELYQWHFREYYRDDYDNFTIYFEPGVSVVFDDVSGAGFVSHDTGWTNTRFSMYINGTSEDWVNFTSASGKYPTNHWTGLNRDWYVNGDREYMGIQGHISWSESKSDNINNCIFESATGSDGAFFMRGVYSNYSNVTIRDSAYGLKKYRSGILNNFVVENITGWDVFYDWGTGEPFIFVNSSFDFEKVNWGYDGGTNKSFVSINHNNVLGDYLIFVKNTTTNPELNYLSKSDIEIDFGSEDNVALMSGNFIVDEDSYSAYFDVGMSGALILGDDVSFYSDGLNLSGNLSLGDNVSFSNNSNLNWEADFDLAGYYDLNGSSILNGDNVGDVAIDASGAVDLGGNVPAGMWVFGEPSVSILNPLNSSYYSSEVEFDISSSVEGVGSVIGNLDDSLVGWWRMEGENSTHIIDYVNNISGVLVGGPEFVVGRSGEGLEFDGDGDMVNISGLYGENFPESGTFGLWVKINCSDIVGNGDGYILDRYVLDRNHIFIRCYDDSNNLQIALQPINTSYVAVMNTFIDSDWNHIAVSYDTENEWVAYYINGEVVENDTINNASWVPDGQQVNLGLTGAGSPLGLMDDFMIFNRTLTGDEVLNLYNASSLNYNLSLEDGGHSLEVYSQDRLGNLAVDGLEFVVDGSAPELEVYSPLNGSYYSSGVEVNASVSDSSEVSLFSDLGLVGWWRMDEGNSTHVFDYVNNISGVLVGDVEVVDGRNGRGVDFDGDDYISVADIGNLSSFAFSLWVNANSVQQDNFAILSKAFWNGSMTGWNLRTEISFPNETRIQFADGTGSWGSVSFGDLRDNSWHHLFFSYNGSSMKAYKDGIFLGEDVFPYVNVETDLRIGRGHLNSATNYFNGTVDDVMVWNRSLSSEEVLALYGNSSSKYLDTLVEVEDGDYEVGVYAQDRVGNIASEVFSVGVDSVEPWVGFAGETPLDNELLNRSWFEVELNVSDENLGYSFVDMDDSLVGYWRGEETSRGSGVGSGEVVAVDESDEFLDLDGDESYVSLDSVVSVGENISLSVWVNRKGDTKQYNPLIEQGGSRRFRLTRDGDAFCFGDGVVTDEYYCTASVFSSTDFWYNVVAVYDGSEHIFVNGVEYNLTQHAGMYGSWASSYLNIGYRPYTAAVGAFNGSIDNVMILNRSLSSEEIGEINESGHRFGGFDDSDLVGKWLFDGDLGDSSGNGNDGTLVGNASIVGAGDGVLVGDAGFVDGRFGNGFEFDGDGDYVNISDDKFNITDDNITISLWAKLNSDDGNWASLVSNNYKQGYFIMQRDAQPRLTFGMFGFSGDGYTEVSITENLTLGTWYNVVAVFDGELKIYLNGELNATRFEMIHPIKSGPDLFIGSSTLAANQRFNGSIDEVMIWNRALGEEEIMSLYNSSEYSYNFSSLEYGYHDFKGAAVDLAGNLNWTEERNVLVDPMGVSCSSLQLGNSFDCSSGGEIESCDLGGQVLSSFGGGNVMVVGDLFGIGGLDVSSGCNVTIKNGINVSFF